MSAEDPTKKPIDISQAKKRTDDDSSYDRTKREDLQEQEDKEKSSNTPPLSGNVNDTVKIIIEQSNLLNKEFNQLGERLKNRFKNKLRPQIEKEIREKNPDDAPQDMINNQIEQELERRASSMFRDIENIIKLPSTQSSDKKSIIRQAKNQINSLLVNGEIDQKEAEELHSFIDRYVDLAEQSEIVLNQLKSHNFADRILAYIKVTDEKHLKLLRSLETPESLKNILLSEYKTKDGKIDFFQFYLDLKEFVIEEILETVESQPNQFFQQAFNEFTYGVVYNTFFDQLRKVTGALADDFEFSHLKGEFYDIEVKTQTPGKIDPESSVPNIVKKEKDLIDLLSYTLNNRLTKLRSIYETLHNAEKIVEEGLGFKTLTEHAHHVSVSDFDWFLYEDKDLTRAYTFYLQNLREEVYLENYILAPDFGNRNSNGLDKPQQRALAQILSLAPEKDEGKMLRKMRRLLRQAGGLSKIYTYDYWLILLNSYLPMAAEEYDDYFKEKGEWKVIKRKKFKPLYRGVGERGPESMLTALASEITWIRFKIPNYYPVLPNVYQPRNFDRYLPLDHIDFYRKGKLREDAFFNGADPEYLKWVKENLRLGEHLKVKLVSAALRRSWRLEDIVYAYTEMIYKEENGEVIDHYNFYKTIGNLWVAGPTFVKEFIDTLNYTKIPDSVWDEIKKELGWEEKKINPKKLSEEEKGAIKKWMYKRFLFTPYFAFFPTKPLMFERREYTPKAEKLIKERIILYLKEKLSRNSRGEISELRKHFAKEEQFEEFLRKEIVPIFINGLEMLARDKFDKQIPVFLDRFAQVKTLADFENAVNYFSFTKRDLNKEALNRFLAKSKKEIGIEYDLSQLTTEFLQQSLTDILDLINEELKKERIEEDILKEKKEINLYDRFIFWALKNLYFAEFGFEGIDLSRISFQGGGIRMVERFAGESFSVAEKFNENITKLFVDGAIALCKANPNQMKPDDFKKFINENLVPPFKEIVDKYAGIDSDAAYDFAKRTIDFFCRVVSMDDRYRILYLGELRAKLDREGKDMRQAALILDTFPPNIDRITGALNKDREEILVKTLATAVNLPWEKYNIAKAGYNNAFDKAKAYADLYEWEFEEKELKYPDFLKKIPIFGKHFQDRKIIISKPVYEKEPIILFGRELGININIFGKKIKIPFTRKVRKLKEGAINKHYLGQIKKVQGHSFDFKLFDRIIPAAVLIFMMILIYLGWSAYKKESEKK